MPIHRGIQQGRPFYQWGNKTKYFYIAGNKISRENAKKCAEKQARAIYASGYLK
jgi:hypothetical protein